MKTVEQLGSWSRMGILGASLRILGASLALLSCTSSHLESSTETGNPPVIDSDKLSLVVANDSVRVVGRPGAVSPGGADVEVTIVGALQVVRGTSRPDGSFDIPLVTSKDIMVEVRAVAGDKRSNAVNVTMASPAVDAATSAALSCMERTNLALQTISSAATLADRSCRTAADCKLVYDRTSCTDSCGPLLVSESSVSSIQSAVAAANEGACANFASDGCRVIANPCVAPPNGAIECVAGDCVRSYASCPSCLNTEVTWGPTSGMTTLRIAGCDDFTRTTATGPGCTGKVAHCSNSGGSSNATIEQFFDALAHPEVEQALASGSTVGGPPAPGGMSTRVTVAGRSFVISNCGSGPNCTTIPDGVQRLRTLLDQVESQTPCEPAACPPNAVFVKDLCLRCGLAGGCAESAERCGIVCSDSSQCASNSPGTVCSARGVCEAANCI